MGQHQKHTAEEYALLFQQGHEEAFDYFFKLYYKTLCFFANGFVKDRAAAEDIAEESFEKLWNNKETINNKSIKAWLYSTTRNACIDHLRRQAVNNKDKAAILYLQQGETANYQFQKMIKTELMNELHTALQQLPAQCRTIFSKLYLEEKAMKDVALEMKLSINTIKSQKARGLKLLRGKLGPIIMLI